MNWVRFIKSVIVCILLVALIGCKSKKEAPGAGVGAPPGKAGSGAVTSPDKAGNIVASPQDMADARTAAAHVLAQMEAGDFSAIYTEAAPGFKQIGPEAAFVAKFQQTRQKTGPLGNPREVSFVTRPDNTHVLVFSVENGRFKSERRLTFTRAKSGKMELFGLNQHDEPKKK